MAHVRQSIGDNVAKLHMPLGWLQRKVWRDALGAFQHGAADMGKGCKVYWPREKVHAFLDAQVKENA